MKYIVIQIINITDEERTSLDPINSLLLQLHQSKTHNTNIVKFK